MSKKITFTEFEKEKAEIILTQLEGMEVISAKKLLKKCQKAILFSRVGNPISNKAECEVR